MSGIQQLLLGGSVQQAVDPYFYSVTSLLHGDGTNGGQNNTFLDSSTNNFTITRNGNTTQGSFSPFSQTGWSNYFDGTGDYLTAPSNAAFQFGTGDFTLECWAYVTGGDNQLFYDFRSSLVSNNGFNFGRSNANGFYIYNNVEGVIIESGAGTAAINTYVHVAVSRSGSTLRLFINGILVKTATNSTNYNSSAVPTIGGSSTTLGTPGNLYTGYISNLRVVKGTAVYTADFTVSTTPLTAISGTSLLTCQANRFLDASSNAFAITRNGDVSVQPFSPFNPITPYSTSSIGGSGYFDGSGDYLNGPATGQFAPTGNFTISMWIYPTSFAASFYVLAGSWNTGTSNEWLIQYDNTGAIRFLTTTDSTFSAAGVIKLNQWQFISISRTGSTLTGYVNGTSFRSYTLTGTVGVATKVVYIGAQQGTTWPYIGYMADFRLVDGSAESATPPTAPATAISGTNMLLNYTNGAIFDNAAVADYETVGNAQISTSVKKYGTGSMLFDGTGDYLSTPFSQLCRIMGGDFTIEMWVYLNAAQANMGLVSSYSSNNGWIARLDTSAIVFGYGTGGAATVVSNSASLSTGVWYHIAFCKIGSSLKTYVNGTQVGTTATISGAVDTTATGLQIGRTHTTTNDFNGYIDDLRISNGVARYPYNFTPPTAEFPNIGGTVTLTADPYFDYTTLLLPGNGTNGAQNNTFLDSSTNNFTITRNGNTTQGTFSPFSQTGWGNYFDGSSDYIQTPSNAALAFGSGDFTIEMWIYPTAKSQSFPAIYSNNVTFGTNWISINYDHDSYPKKVVAYIVNSSTSPLLVSASQFAHNSWYHVAMTRSGSTFRLFVNGTLQATGTFAGSADGGSSHQARIGSGPTLSSDEYTGYISNARIVKGTAVYTANFTPPTTPLTAITNTSLLTCQSNRFIDNSTNAFAITRNGDVSVQAFSPFNPTAAWSASTNGGSGYFDGSGDYLTVPDNAALQMGSGDFTVEYWWYPNNITSYQNPIDKGYTGTGALLLQTGNGDGRIIVYASGSAVVTSSTAVRANAWNHMALVRSGTTLTLYQNGASVGSATNSTNFNSTAPLGIGATATAPGGGGVGSFPIVGFLSGVRFVKGTAVYSGSTYTVPTAPLTAITNTSLLTNFTNAGIYDATSKNDLETVGNAQISTTQSKFGGSSMAFDGTGDWLRAPASPNLDMGTGDLTIEGWFYLTATVAVDYRMIVSDATNGNNYVAIRSGGTGGQLEINVNGTSFRLNLNNTVTINTWFHLAVVRYNGTWNGFVNGASLGTSAAAAAFNLGNGGTFVGRFGGATAYEWPGYIDDFRITKGIARYTSNFTPPTTAFLTL